MIGLTRIVFGLFSDILKLELSFLRPASAIRAENLVFRRQLAKYIERGIKPWRIDCATLVLCEFAFTPLSAFEKYPGNVVAKRSDRVKCNAALAYQIFPTACCR